MAKDAALKSVRGSRLRIAIGMDLGHLETRIQEAIARRAYDLFEKRGRQHGSDLADWFRAEEEIERPANVSILEDASEIKVRTQVPGFLASEIQVGISPDHVVIWGLKTDSGNSLKPNGRPSAGGFGALLADVRLPSPVNPAKSTASFEEDWIEVRLTKESS